VKPKKASLTTLRQSLSYEPVELAFGTSGLRGLVRDITSLEAYVNTRGFLSWAIAVAGVRAGTTVFIAGDLRPSTTAIVPDEDFRGDILSAVHRAAVDAGLSVAYLGRIPTPALVLYAMRRGSPGIMVTGSHIPHDRNGIKFTLPSGEVLKGHEPPILEAVRAARKAEYGRASGQSIFDQRGMLRPERRLALPEEVTAARTEYRDRFTAAFPAAILTGRRILVWEHSAVGRDLIAEIISSMGAEVIRAGRSETFVPVDTEAVNPQMLDAVQSLVHAHGGAEIDAVISTDGDGDRPLVLAVENGMARFIPGDLLGMIAAGFLGVRHCAVPVNVNDAIDLWARGTGIAVEKTRIGSPYVISAMREAGWEGNGGFLTAARLAVPGGGSLDPLPTRDAMLPICCVLSASLGRGRSLAALLETLPARHGSSTALRDYPMAAAREIMTWLSPSDPSVVEARFAEGRIVVRSAGAEERMLAEGDPLAEEIRAIRTRIARSFDEPAGFSDVRLVNWLDGVRMGFHGGDILHLRPSGNAPEMRLYATADSAVRADALISACASGGGIIRRMAADSFERVALANYRALPRAVTLLGATQHYPWGGFDFIPGLTGIENSERLPFAELWLGAHPRGPATALIDDARIPLDRLIAADPWLTLGPEVALRHAGQLPYLFKILDVRVMLSLQAHPSRAQAEEGFARENAAGIPLDAPHRNYRDENHKPEVHVALTEFWMLHGFRPLAEIADTLEAERELALLMPGFGDRLRAARENGRAALLQELYSHLMTMPQADIDELAHPLVSRLEAEEARGVLNRERHGFWALSAARTFPLADGHRDRGVLSMYLLNLVHLKPGQGTYQPAGTLHAYLEGVNVELMANSDNVLRGGLTTKHVDVPELLATLSFHDGLPHVIEGRTSSETSREYETPAMEFALERIEVAPGAPYSGGREHSVDTLIALEGAAAVIAVGRTLALGRGGCAMVPAGVPYSIAARSPKALLFKAGVPARE
jgi:mannose-6-phosphate isomerase class I